MNIVGEHSYMKDEDGIDRKIHIDMSTKLDKVPPGDLVNAYVTNQGHTTTLQRTN